MVPLVWAQDNFSLVCVCAESQSDQATRPRELDRRKYWTIICPFSSSSSSSAVCYIRRRRWRVRFGGFVYSRTYGKIFVSSSEEPIHSFSFGERDDRLIDLSNKFLPHSLSLFQTFSSSFSLHFMTLLFMSFSTGSFGRMRRCSSFPHFLPWALRVVSRFIPLACIKATKLFLPRKNPLAGGLETDSFYQAELSFPTTYLCAS